MDEKWYLVNRGEILSGREIIKTGKIRLFRRMLRFDIGL